MENTVKHRKLNRFQAAQRRERHLPEQISPDPGYFIVEEDLSADSDIAPYLQLNERLHNEEV